MSEKVMYDKLIHKNEFRLRILLTNECNKDCVFCLNDFQPKEPVAYANISDTIDCLRAYGSFMKDKSIVTFSGGEPGLHPALSYILRKAKKFCKIVKVITNGMALRTDLTGFVDVWHVGVAEKNFNVITFLQCSKKIIVQIVVTESLSIESLIDLVQYYYWSGIKVKLFTDFNSNRQHELQSKVKHLSYIFNNGVITRFTGKQINKGKVCSGCEKKCVTLKALWVFPDGRATTCPQGITKLLNGSWDEIVEQAYNLHL